MAATCAAAGCDRRDDSAPRVLVIGAAPRLADPNIRPLASGEAVLLANLAQGLVRFDARGQIEPGLAERWNVSDDGLSYIFRLGQAEWPNGRKITAQQVARLLKRATAKTSGNGLRDTLGAVDEIVAMTDRVLEIRLSAPRPNLLQLLAQPELALVREGAGGGPFTLANQPAEDGALVLRRSVAGPDGDDDRREEVRLSGAAARDAVRRFAADEADLVLGGTFADLPYARAVKLKRRTLQFDPVAGLFGLVVVRKTGPLEDPEVRHLLSQAIDREALIGALEVPGLVPRATVLEGGLEGIADVPQPAFLATPLAERRQALVAAADRLFGKLERPLLRIALPEGPGADQLLARLAADWAVIGIRVERTPTGMPSDLRLVDRVAPSSSPAWFVRHFRCGESALCDAAIDELLDAARAAPVAAQRAALLADAARRIDELQPFLPIAAPVRWSLVSPRIEGFAGNRFGRHTLTALGDRLNRERAE
ncbi:ABC transporter substrate-binding protein [Sphingomonas sp.]|uniref:ABC transporter substrate-binding protein n=1 Tax=Sphingomonas sp. TaxID=28214 RepID=UPI00286E3A69|nr:ABC transporter substrate-binding protein [Sphingomonas sp.]